MYDENAKESVGGYEIKQSYLFKDKTGIALAENPDSTLPYVTWQFIEGESGARIYSLERYFLCGINALKDFTTRVIDRSNEFDGVSHENYRYYAIRQRIVYNTYPRPNGSDPIDIVCFDNHARVENGRLRAWGYIEYAEPLSKKLITDFGLRAASNNPEIRAPIRKQTHISYREQFGADHRDKKLVGKEPAKPKLKHRWER